MATSAPSTYNFDDRQAISEGQDLLTLLWLWRQANLPTLGPGLCNELSEILSSTNLTDLDFRKLAFQDLTDHVLGLEQEPFTSTGGPLLELDSSSLGNEKARELFEWLARTEAHDQLVSEGNSAGRYDNLLNWEELRQKLGDDSRRCQATNQLIAEIRALIETRKEGSEPQAEETEPVTAFGPGYSFEIQHFDDDGWIEKNIPRIMAWTPTPGLRPLTSLTREEDTYKFLALDLQNLANWSSFRHGADETLFEQAERLFRLLSRLHSRGVYHLTLTPSTVYLAPDGPLISDYYWAVLSPRDILPNQYPKHAARYAAPEAITGHPVPSSDFFSLAWLIIDSLGGNSHSPSELEKLGLSPDQLSLLTRMTQPVERRADEDEIRALFRNLSKADPTRCCRVCGLEQDYYPWGPDCETPSFQICACCGVEFGTDDVRLSEIISRRQAWIEGNYSWFTKTKRPPNWSIGQLSNIPKEWTIDGLD